MPNVEEPWDLLQELAGAEQQVLTPSPQTAESLVAAGIDARVEDLDSIPSASASAIVLSDGELARAQHHAEVLIDAAANALGPGGILLATVPGLIHHLATGTRVTGRAFTAAGFQAALEHRGYRVHKLRGRGIADESLADAAPLIDAAGRAPRSPTERSEVFFSTLPTKLVAASVVCRDEAGRLLVVHDSFRGHWTIPGGVVDHDEDPRAAARRETWEEAGVRVEVGALKATFHALWPDRLHLLYEATPLDAEIEPDPVHRHEISAAEWLPLSDALARIAPHMAARVRTAL